MPLSQRRLDKLVTRTAGQRFDALEERYQRVMSAYYAAQRDFHSTQQECVRLRTVVRVKQRLVKLLLPYYPHPLTPELQQQIDLV